MPSYNQIVILGNHETDVCLHCILKKKKKNCLYFQSKSCVLNVPVITSACDSLSINDAVAAVLTRFTPVTHHPPCSCRTLTSEARPRRLGQLVPRVKPNRLGSVGHRPRCLGPSPLRRPEPWSGRSGNPDET